MFKQRLRDSILHSFRNRIAVIVVWVLLCIVSFGVLSLIVKQLREKEQYYVSIWSYAMSQYGMGDNNPLIELIVNKKNTIPFIITDERLQVKFSHLIPDKILHNPDLLRKKIDHLASVNEPITFLSSMSGARFFVFFGKSKLLNLLTFFPLFQIIAFAALMWVGIFAFRYAKVTEQDRVWVGLAKETAHQLGTPTSSLLGWVEYLRNQPIDQRAVEEINKDLAHLMKIVDRFSKIGSSTPLRPEVVNEIVGESVMYFRTRIPKNVEIRYNGLAMAPIRAMINPALFEWVIENLLKNALDALQGKGLIDVTLSDDDHYVYIDVRDTGKGIPKANFKKIFEPGFTTKTRGWGLGLSLSRRVIEEYHKGKIYVVDSEIGRGSTIRVALKILHG